MKEYNKTEYQAKHGDRAVSYEIPLTSLPTEHADFPVKLQKQSEAASAILQTVLADIGTEIRMTRDLPVGQRLDPRKRRSVGRAMRRGRVDPYELRPYMRRDVQPTFPHVGIVASTGVGEIGQMNGEKEIGWQTESGEITYIMRVVQTVMALSWALESVGAPVTSALTMGLSHKPQNRIHDYCQLSFILSKDGMHVPLQQYSQFADISRFYVGGIKRFIERNETFATEMSRIRGIPRHKYYWGNSISSISGRNGVHWMNSVYKPDIIISLGNNSDSQDANLVIPKNQWTVIELVQKFASQLRHVMLR